MDDVNLLVAEYNEEIEEIKQKIRKLSSAQSNQVEIIERNISIAIDNCEKIVSILSLLLID